VSADLIQEQQTSEV